MSKRIQRFLLERTRVPLLEALSIRLIVLEDCQSGPCLWQLPIVLQPPIVRFKVEGIIPTIEYYTV